MNKRYAKPTKKSLLFLQRHPQKKLARRLVEKRLRPPLLMATDIKSKSIDAESLVRGVIGYVRELKKQVKDLRTEIALLQSNICNTRHKNAARNATTVTTFDAHNKNNDEMQAYKKGGCQHGDYKEVIQENLAGADHDFHTDMLQALHVKEVKEGTFDIQIRCKREARVLQRLTKTLESLPLPMEFYKAEVNAEDGHFITNVLLKTKAPMNAEMLRQAILDAAALNCRCCN